MVYSRIALYNFIAFDRLKGGDSKDSVVLLDIGADNTDLIITDGTRIWQRNVPIGGNHFTRALTKELKLTFAKAEHLKRNATKAPDPRSIFTAMRGVFNDFASEINRSIGFYSSVNRTAKISKVVGLGNGFKLPGLQKFLQQNLSNEVEKLDAFTRLEGDDVKGQPVFQDNLPSFAVAYGLAVQALGKSGLRTNLLPPEITQVRLIRAKKPWALAASALLMLGFSALFLGDYRVLAKVSSTEFTIATEEANRVSKQGAAYQSAYDTAKGTWTGKDAEGKTLIGNAGERGMWPSFLKTLSGYFPDPVTEYKLDPTKPTDQPKLEKLRVHIDALKPVWREDVAAEWFSASASPPAPTDTAKSLMHPYDRANPPAGAGWIVQIVGHHYNPYPTSEQQARLPENSPARYEFGPYGYLVRKIIPALLNPRLRVEGVHHVTLAWMTSDKEWTSEKGAKTNGFASNTVPLLPRPTPPVAASGSGGSMEMAGYASMMNSQGQNSMMGAMAGSGGSNDAMYANMMNSGMMGSAMGGGASAAAKAKEKLSTLTRTDFLIQMVWQPVKAEDAPKTPEELKTKIEEEIKKMIDAQKNSEVRIPTPEEVEKASLAQSKVVESALMKVQQQAQAAAKTKGGAATPAAATVPVVAPPEAPAAK